MKLPTPMPGCHSVPCPRCGSVCPCYDHLEVDIGVGVQTGEHTYCCSTHGSFAWGWDSGEVVFQDDQFPQGPYDDEDFI